jgi:hypothetical protein
MSKERELLKRVRDALHELKETHYDLYWDIQSMLDQPEQEPVAWIIETEIYGKLSEWVCTDKKHYIEAHDAIKAPIPLYTAPQKREPLSDEEIKMKWNRLPTTTKDPIIRLARAIEKAHSIGVDDEN